MGQIHVFTSAAYNYIPKVRLLAESVKKWHPEWVMHLALADAARDDVDLGGEPFDEVHPADSLGIPDFTGWAFCHSIVELSTAIKPYLLRRLLERDDCDAVLYFDPDMVLFSRLDDIVSALDESNIVLTPHQVEPDAELRDIIANEIGSALKHGVYNLGFIGVKNTETGRTFAEWWSDRLYYFCRDEVQNGLFTDQRWIDLVPGFFEGVCIMRSARHNVAPWNLTTRHLSGRMPDVSVNGEPLGFYHFTGFDSGAHAWRATDSSRDNSDVGAIVNWYKKSTKHAKRDPISSIPWAYGYFTDGTEIPKISRLIYRQRPDLQSAFPNPFDCHDGGYKQWVLVSGAAEYEGLFDPERQRAEILRLTANLTPGFQAGDSTGNQRHVSLKQLFTNYRTTRMLTGRAWQVLRTEGGAETARRITRALRPTRP